MIQMAISELHEEGGSTEKAILDYIKENYEDLPWAHATILRHHLKHLSESREVLCISGTHFMLPGQKFDYIAKRRNVRKRKMKDRQFGRRERFYKNKDGLQSRDQEKEVMKNKCFHGHRFEIIGIQNEYQTIETANVKEQNRYKEQVMLNGLHKQDRQFLAIDKQNPFETIHTEMNAANEGQLQHGEESEAERAQDQQNREMEQQSKAKLIQKENLVQWDQEDENGVRSHSQEKADRLVIEEWFDAREDDGSQVEEIMGHHTKIGKSIAVYEKQNHLEQKVDLFEKSNEANQKENEISEDLKEQEEQQVYPIERETELGPHIKVNDRLGEVKLTEENLHKDENQGNIRSYYQWGVHKNEYNIPKSDTQYQRKVLNCQEQMLEGLMNDLAQKKNYKVEEACHAQQQSKAIGGQNQHDQQVEYFEEPIRLHEEKYEGRDNIINSSIVKEIFFKKQEINDALISSMDVPNSSLSLQKMNCHGSLLSPMEKCLKLLHRARKIEDKLLELIYSLSAIQAS